MYNGRVFLVCIVSECIVWELLVITSNFWAMGFTRVLKFLVLGAVLVTKWFGPIALLYQHLKFIWLFIYESRLWAKFSPTSSSPTICSMSYSMYYTIPSILGTHIVVWHTTLPSCMHAFIHTKFSVPMEFNSAKHDFGFWHQYYLCLLI